MDMLSFIRSLNFTLEFLKIISRKRFHWVHFDRNMDPGGHFWPLQKVTILKSININRHIILNGVTKDQELSVTYLYIFHKALSKGLVGVHNL